ncbi:MAG TPA: outer membrane beta-barrel protein, partial [Paludibacter sp.]|nr:outer membrane beta-barrel protein [Paludibacter sp.]
FKTENLTGYQLGLNYQMFSRKNKYAGGDIGLYISQKGFAYSDSTKLLDIVTLGYKELNYLELPINFRYRFSTKIIGIYGTGGVYGGYVLSGKTVNETENSTEELPFLTDPDRFDYGYCLGAGVEFFKKVQFGLSWTQGLKNFIAQKIQNSSTQSNTDNRVFSVNLTYIIK